MHTFGGAGQLKFVYLMVSGSSASALLSTHLPIFLVTAVPATLSYPTPGPLMSTGTPLINTGQPTVTNKFTGQQLYTNKFRGFYI